MKRATWVLMATIALAGCSGAGEEPDPGEKRQQHKRRNRNGAVAAQHRLQTRIHQALTTPWLSRCRWANWP